MIKIGVISPADIAFRRFMPAVLKNKNFQYIGLAMYSRAERFIDERLSLNEQNIILQKEKQKAEKFVSTYGGKLYNSYSELINSDEVDAIYLPLPPALHYPYAQKILSQRKHLLLEKPATIQAHHSQELLKQAKANELALCENYMFIYHKQIKEIKRIISEKSLGDIRLLSMKFGFPERTADDFRYKRDMGGGALFDAGGYPVKLATTLMGETSDVICACLNTIPGYEVDMYGNATLVNEQGITAQIAFGMDNEYRCELELWGSQGTFRTGRVFTAPEDLMTVGTIVHAGVENVLELGRDNAFANSIQHFYDCIYNLEKREQEYREIELQADLIQCIYKKGQRF